MLMNFTCIITLFVKKIVLERNFIYKKFFKIKMFQMKQNNMRNQYLIITQIRIKSKKRFQRILGWYTSDVD